MPLKNSIYPFILCYMMMVMMGCDSKKFLDDDIFPFPGPQMICFGNFGNNQPISVTIQLSKHPLDTTAFSSYEEAKVDLWVNGLFSENLIFSEGKYISPNQTIPQTGDNYVIKASAPDLLDIESGPVQLPAPPDVNTISLEKLETERQYLLSVAIADPDTAGNFYSFDTNHYFEGNFIARSSGAENRFDIKEFTTDVDFNGSIFTRELLAFSPLFRFGPDGVPSPEPTDEVRIKVYHLSQEYNFARDNKSVELGGLFPNESTYYSNIKGGFGLIGTYWVVERAAFF